MGLVLLNQRSELVQILTKIVRGGASVLQLSNRMLREDKYDAGNSVFILRVVAGCHVMAFAVTVSPVSNQTCWSKERVYKSGFKPVGPHTHVMHVEGSEARRGLAFLFPIFHLNKQ